MPDSSRSTPVTDVAAADPAAALTHFQQLLAFETDCWDVHVSLSTRHPDFVLLDVRSAQAFAAGHVPGARSLPHRRITERALASYPADTLFVVYCSGPHCNGADRAAVALARLGRRVKKMIGGVTGWKDEGFALVCHDAGPTEHGMQEAPIDDRGTLLPDRRRR
jgi:rhodanese-related sulfurtransferase